jgi:hypothetical protein
MRTTLSRLSALALTSALSFTLGCAGDTGDAGESSLPGFEDWLDDKSDTGYIGNRAAELEATFTGRVRVELPDKTAAELTAIADALREDPRNWQHRDITMQVTEQIKYARNALKAEQFDLNLEGGSPTFPSIEPFEGGLVLDYAVTVESLVKFKDLEERGLTPQDLVGRVVEPKLPLVPKGLFDRIGAACATDTDTGNPPPAEDLGAHNLFYYFDSAREGCPLTTSDLVVARYEVSSSFDAPTVYPEYDQLVADGKITMVALFGQIEHGELSDYDWGFRSYGTFTRELRYLGFSRTEKLPDNRGERMAKTYPGGLEITVDVYTPVDFADEVPRDQANEAFREAMRTHEIVYYNGHAFYGSLKVLDEPTAYPADTYQIIFMDACWSYAYYTKQVFRNKATDSDPDGYALADVVNNTEPGITGSEATAVVLYDNIFKGAAAVHASDDATRYSWNNMTAYMNAHAEERASRRVTHPDPEIYGASGVLANAYQPGGSEPPPEPEPDALRFESNGSVAIPDDDANGATSVIDVPVGTGAALSVIVEAQIDHTFIGDLTVVVEHAGQSVVLHDRSGGATENLSLELAVDDFAGNTADGSWTLHVVDGAAIDEGTITRWAVVVSTDG